MGIEDVSSFEECNGNSISNACHNLNQEILKGLNAYVVKRGDTLFSVFHKELGMTNYLGSYSKMIKTVYENGKVDYKHTTADFKEIEVGDKIYIKDGVLIIERSPIKQYTYSVTSNNEDIFNITNDVFNLGFSVRQYILTERILFMEKQNNEEIFTEILKDKDVKDLLKKGDIFTVKKVNGTWQFIIERPFKGVFDRKVPVLSDQKKKKIEEPVKIVEIKKKDPLESTKAYAKRLTKGLPSNKKTEFQNGLSRRLSNVDRTSFDLNKPEEVDRLNREYTKVRVEWGREFFPKLTGNEFEEFYRNTGVKDKAFGNMIANLLGKEPGKVEPNIKKIKGAYPSELEIKTFINNKYGNLIKKYSKEFSLRPAFLRSIIQQETKGDFLAVSKSGAFGLGQHLSGVWQRKFDKKSGEVFGLFEFKTSINPLDRESNIFRTAEYLKKIFKYLGREKRFVEIKNKETAVASAYNMGPRHIKNLIHKYGKNFIYHLEEPKIGDPSYGNKVTLLAQK